MEKRNRKEVPFSFLTTSRWDFGGSGCRPGLLQQAKERAEEHKAEFHVVAGGVVNQRAVRQTANQMLSDIKAEASKLNIEISELKIEIKSLERQKQNIKGKKAIKAFDQKIEKKLISLDRKKEELKTINKRKSVRQITNEMIEPLARKIDESLPQFFKPNGSIMKHYIVTSYTYDGAFGCSVVKRLVELRKESGKNDVIYVNAGNTVGTTHRIKLKSTNKTFAVVVPNKSPWRSRFYSTASDRYLEDESKRTTQKLCDVYAYGCGSSSLNRREGEIPFQRITIPSLCKLESADTSENMIGLRILKFIPGLRNIVPLTIQLKDLVSAERQSIKVPANFSDIQKAIFEEIKKEANLSLGLLGEYLEISRDRLEKELNDSKIKKAGLVYDELSGTYDFDKSLFMNQQFSWPKSDFKKEVIASFGCMHAGSIHTHYRFITQEFPKLIAASRAKSLFALGDQIEGIEHQLIERGEVAVGMDNTTQEELSAFLIAEVILSALDFVLQDLISSNQIKIKDLTPQAVEALIDEHLIRFWYWIGNHDDWPLKKGVRPLITFDKELRNHLFRSLNKVLVKNNLTALSMEVCDRLVQNRVVRMHKNHARKLPTGTAVDGAHYYARRSATSSAWPQTALADLKDGHLVYCANFHVEEIVEEWSWKLGLRVSIMLPTLKSGSAFENNMGKRTDFGAAIQTFWSHDGRGMMSETALIGENPHTSFDNNEGFKLLLDYAKAGKWTDVDKYLKERL